MKPEHLPYFIDDEIYRVGQKVTEEAAKSSSYKIAFIHSSNSDEEKALLEKIIGACKLDAGDYIIGDDIEKVDSEKYVVFTPTAASPFQINNEGDKIVMQSSPLSTLLNSQDEKAKLWKSLQEML